MPTLSPVWKMSWGVYTRPYDARHPQVCLDETSKQLVSETRTPLPLQPGEPERYDYEYERQGVCTVLSSV